MTSHLFNPEDYKLLRSGNKYHPLDTPHLTTTAARYCSQSSFHPYKKSTAFGYPGRHQQLGIRPQKQTMKTLPFLVPAKLIAEQHPLPQLYDLRIQHF